MAKHNNQHTLPADADPDDGVEIFIPTLLKIAPLPNPKQDGVLTLAERNRLYPTARPTRAKPKHKKAKPGSDMLWAGKLSPIKRAAPRKALPEPEPADEPLPTLAQRVRREGLAAYGVGTDKTGAKPKKR